MPNGSVLFLVFFFSVVFWLIWLWWITNPKQKNKRKNDETYYPEKPKREEKETFELTLEVYTPNTVWGRTSIWDGYESDLTKLEDENTETKLFHTDEDSKK